MELTSRLSTLIIVESKESVADLRELSQWPHLIPWVIFFIITLKWSDKGNVFSRVYLPTEGRCSDRWASLLHPPSPPHTHTPPQEPSRSHISKLCVISKCRHPHGQTPPDRHLPPRKTLTPINWSLQRTVCILQECILVSKCS